MQSPLVHMHMQALLHGVSSQCNHKKETFSKTEFPSAIENNQSPLTTALNIKYF